MVTPAGPQPLPDEPLKAEKAKSAPSKKSTAAKTGENALQKTGEEPKTIEQKVSWLDNGIGKEIGSIWDRIAGKTKTPPKEQAFREEMLVKARAARMARLEDLAKTNDPLAIDLLQDCKNGRINADQAVIILGTIQHHNERVEGIIGHALTPKQKLESYGQLFTELKKLSKNPQTQSAIDALIRKHAMK